MPKDSKNINRQIAKGSAWMALFKIFEKSISIISTIVLARLLIPEDFGLVAMAMMVVALVELMRAFGFDMALIQNQTADTSHYNTAWTFNVIAAGIISVTLLFVTPVAAGFYNDERLIQIMPLLSIGVLISGLENIGVVAFRKELTFHKEFIYLLSKKAIGFFAALSLAFYFKNYWALVGAYIITQSGVVILSFFVHNYRPRFCLSKARELFAFSGWLFINNFLTFIFQKGPEIIIGKLSNASVLGIFTIARDIAITTSGEIVAPVNRAAFPGYSKLSQNHPELKRSFLNTIGLIAIIVIPASTGLSAVSSTIVPVLLGEKWQGAAPIMEIISISGMLFAIGNINAIYLALGKPRILTKIMLLRVTLSIPLLIYLTNLYGVIGAAWGLTTIGIIMLPISYRPVMTTLKIRLSELTMTFIRPALAAFAMYFCIHYTSLYLTQNNIVETQVFILATQVIIGIVSYVFTILSLWYIAGKPISSEKHILLIFSTKLAKILPRKA